MSKPDPLISSMNYEIKIRGKLDEQWSSWFNGLMLSCEQVDDNYLETTLMVCTPDQAKLRGILNKIWDLNLTIISVRYLEEGRD